MRVGRLLDHAIHAALQVEVVGVLHLVGGNNPRSHRQVPVETLAAKPLLTVVALHFARRHIIGHRVTKHMFHGVGFADVAPAGADDHGEFNFPIELLGHRAMRRHIAVRGVHRQRLLGKKCRMRGHFLHMRARFCALIEMVEVVPADAKHIFARARYGRVQLHLVELVMARFHLGNRCLDGGKPLFAAAHQ